MTLKNSSQSSQSLSVNEGSFLTRLTQFGFTNAEATIYIYLLQKGIETGGTKIAIGTQLHRQYVYMALPRLIADGLVEEVAHGKQAKYKARPPYELEKIGRKKALYASDLARDLDTISAVGNDQTFEVIQGVQAIQQYESELVARADDTWECYIIGGGSAGYSRVMDGILEEHLAEMKKKKLSVKYIGSVDEKPFYQDYIGKFENQEYRFMEKLPKGVTHLVVRKDTVSFYSFLTPPLVYVVKSEQVAENYKQFFMMLWEMV